MNEKLGLFINKITGYVAPNVELEDLEDLYFWCEDYFSNKTKPVDEKVLNKIDKIAVTVADVQELYEKYKILESDDDKVDNVPAHTHTIQTHQLARVIKYYENILNDHVNLSVMKKNIEDRIKKLFNDRIGYVKDDCPDIVNEMDAEIKILKELVNGLNYYIKKYENL